MIKINNPQKLFWQNRFSEYPVVCCEIELGFNEKWRANQVPTWALEYLEAHFFARNKLHSDMTVKDVLIWIVKSISAFWDITRPIADITRNDATGKNELYCAYGDEHLSHVKIECSVNVINQVLAQNWEDKISFYLEIRRQYQLLDFNSLGLASRAFVRAAETRGIFWRRYLSGAPYVMFGFGINRKIVSNYLPWNEGFFPTNLAKDKASSLFFLSKIGLPIGSVKLAFNAMGAVNAAARIGYPVTLKPRNMAQGKGVWVKLENQDELAEAARKLETAGIEMIVQSYFPGADHRLLVVDGKYVAAARRIPVGVMGDGVCSIRELIVAENSNPQRGAFHSRLLEEIVVDDGVLSGLSKHGMDITTIPDKGHWIQLRLTANISTGGTADDVTDFVHPDNIRAAERAARQLGLKVAGVDLIISDISKSWKKVGGGICEINSTPGLRPHWIANTDRDVIEPMLNLSFSEGEQCDVPVAMITGSNGKTTTTLMLMQILRAAGHHPGGATTDGVIIGDEWLLKADMAGVSGGRYVLDDPDITAAVLETARGGILKRGIILPRCNASALLNIQREQIEIDGVETIEGMLEVKRKVTDIAEKAKVLNVDDPLIRELVKEYPADTVIAFSLDERSPEIFNAIKLGCAAIAVGKSGKQKNLVFLKGDMREPICPVDDIPVTMNGAHIGNVTNAMAAAGLALGMGVSIDDIAKGLRSCEITKPGEPGRMIWMEGYEVEVLIDWASNPESFKIVVPALAGHKNEGKRICLVTSIGNRPEWTYTEISQEIAGAFDHYICYERPDFVRNRQPGEISAHLGAGLSKAGVEKKAIHSIANPHEAMNKAKELSEKGDLLCIFGGSSTYLLSLFRDCFGDPPIGWNENG